MTVLAEQVLRHKGRSVRYLAGGRGEPLVLCHGFLGSAENFEAWFDRLAGDRTLLIPDLPGSGASDPLPGEHTISALADEVVNLIDALEIGPFDLGGLCLGSPVACAVARHRPSGVRRLILHTPLLAPSMVRSQFHAQSAVLTAPGVFDLAIRLARKRVVSDLYKRLLVEGDGVDPAAAAANFANQVRAHPRAQREWLRAGLRAEDAALVGALGIPTLMLVAADDRIVNVPRLRRLAADVPSVQLDVVEHAGHGWTDAVVAHQLDVITAFMGQRASAPV